MVKGLSDFYDLIEKKGGLGGAIGSLIGADRPGLLINAPMEEGAAFRRQLEQLFGGGGATPGGVPVSQYAFNINANYPTAPQSSIEDTVRMLAMLFNGGRR
jgi:hypothetical protein